MTGPATLTEIFQRRPSLIFVVSAKNRISANSFDTEVTVAHALQ